MKTLLQSKKRSITFFTATLLLFFSITIVASTKEAVNENDKTKKTTEISTMILTEDLIDISWTLDKTVNNVDFYHKLIACGDKKAVLLKIENRNNFNVEITWKQIIGSKQIPNSTEESSTSQTLIVEPGITESVDCSENNNPILVILPTEINPTFLADIENFNFSSITIKELN
jgi:hypothetical protein